MTDTPDNPASGEVIDAPDVSGAWLAPAAAASSLGVSERTLWRHVTAGRYHKRVVAGRAEILVPGSADNLPDNSDTAIAPVTPDNPDILSVAIIQELRRQHEDAVERLTRQAEEIGTLKARLAAAEARAAEAERRIAAWRWWNPKTW